MVDALFVVHSLDCDTMVWICLLLMMFFFFGKAFIIIIIFVLKA